MNNPKSEELFERAQQVIPGGVNSPVRAFQAVSGTPVFFERGNGSKLYSSDGKEYIDFCCSWGPLILGHAHPAVVKAVHSAASNGLSFGTCTEKEIELAELLRQQIPYMEMTRLVNSGTEAVMTAIRLARGHTKRNKILKYEGCYHGHADNLLVSAGSGLLTEGIASSAGVTTRTASEVLVAPYNNLAATEQIINRHGDELAAVIIEPIAGNMGLVMPESGFLEGLRALTQEKGIILIFDEVITAFRLKPTTYGVISGITPDLTCLGKIIGGGMPIGAVGGKSEIMKHLAPLGRVYQAGTLSGNPVAVAAGLAMLEILINEDIYSSIDQRSARLAVELNRLAQSRNIDLHCAQKGSMLTPFFTKNPIRNLSEAKCCNTAAFKSFFHKMLAQGIYLPPSQYELSFLSYSHTDQDTEYFIEAASKSLT